MPFIKNGGGGASKVKQLASSTGRWWSQTLEQITTIINGEERKVKTTPLSYKKRIVFMGSSSTEGTGTTNAQTKYYGKLIEAKLGTAKYEFYHRGVGGDQTTGARARFYNDIAPINADFVFLAFTIGNEGMYNAADSAARKVVYDNFKKGILELCHMVQQQGAVPIVFTQAPTRSYTPEIYALSEKMNAEFEAMGIHCVDWGGVVDAMDGTGKPIDSIMNDNLHYKDAAHVEIANAVPPTFFEKASFQDGRYLYSPKGYINTGALVSSTPITYAPTDLTTYTIGVRFNLSSLASASIMSFGVQDKLTINSDGSIGLHTFATGTLIQDLVLPVGTVVTGRWYHAVVSYNAIMQEIRVYIDGVLKLTKATTAMPITLLTFGGRAGTTATLKNALLKDAVIYRTRLTDNKVAALFEGKVSQTSLEIFSPLHDKVLAGGNNLINLAPTNVNLTINATETALTAVSSQLY
jgi:hypothetical protein